MFETKGIRTKCLRLAVFYHPVGELLLQGFRGRARSHFGQVWQSCKYGRLCRVFQPRHCRRSGFASRGCRSIHTAGDHRICIGIFHCCADLSRIPSAHRSESARKISPGRAGHDRRSHVSGLSLARLFAPQRGRLECAPGNSRPCGGDCRGNCHAAHGIQSGTISSGA